MLEYVYKFQIPVLSIIPSDDVTIGFGSQRTLHHALIQGRFFRGSSFLQTFKNIKTYAKGFYDATGWSLNLDSISWCKLPSVAWCSVCPGFHTTCTSLKMLIWMSQNFKIIFKYKLLSLNPIYSSKYIWQISQCQPYKLPSLFLFLRHVF